MDKQSRESMGTDIIIATKMHGNRGDSDRYTFPFYQSQVWLQKGGVKLQVAH